MNKKLVNTFLISVFIILVSLSKVVLASGSIDKNITLSATIDYLSFFSFQIKEFYFEDRNIEIDIDYKNNRLIDKSTYLIVKTDAPSFFPAGYIISAEELSSSCRDQKGNEFHDIARYYLGGIRLIKNYPISFDDFNRSDTFLWVKKEFYIKFNSTNNFDLNTSRCGGKVVLRAQLDL
ncbi:TPA: hypothetical protein ACX6QK_001267 [Photobacterium damselae]